MAGRLKHLDIERATSPGKYADGGGLYLVISGPTTKNWSYRYWKDGKERWHGLGSFKDVSLKDARLARDAARLRVKGDRNTPGVDIVQERRQAREEIKTAEVEAKAPTFEECAEEYIREHWSTWSKKHREQWPSSLKRYAYPTIGKLTMAEIRPSYSRSARSYLGEQTRDGQPRSWPDLNYHREERRHRRQGLPQPGATY